ncbi:MAG: hypothetical protein ACP5US_04040 [Candidatus Kryptoniota bacterium]
MSQENQFKKVMIAGLLFLIAIFSPGCTHGISPLSVQPGFGGSIHFTSAWPSPDSVKDIRVVAFYHYPPVDIIGEVLSGAAKVYPPIGSTSLPLFVDSLNYRFETDPSTFEYVVVALQYGPNLFSDWKVVGAYGYEHGVGKPKKVIIPEDTFVNGINIDVDFKNTPPTPSGAGGIAAK